MAQHEFDPGYGKEPFKSLCEDYPDETVYPRADFRVEWGPIFHRGRLDGSARVVVLGQDPAQHETIVRRILVGEAGQRLQGLLAKLGIDESYVMINTFIYSVFGQGGGTKHKNDPAIAAYRHRWLDAVVTKKVEAVISLGMLADLAYVRWKATKPALNHAYAHITHPTQPESSSKGDKAKHAAAIQAMLANWNQALQALKPAIKHPDVSRPLVLYGSAFAAGDLAPIPEKDYPPGFPEWTRGLAAWATRSGDTPAQKRAQITVKVPKGAI